MSKIKISELPSAPANVNSVVPASDINANVTNKVTIGSIIGLVPVVSGSGNSSVRGQASNAASGDYSVSLGENNVASGDYSTIIGGAEARASHYGSLAHSSGSFSVLGDAQHYVFISRNFTTDNTPTPLFLDGSVERLAMPTKSTWTFQIKLSAYNDTDNEAAGWIISGAIKNDNLDNTSLIGSTITYNWSDPSLSTASVIVGPDVINYALDITVVGVSSKNIRWVAIVDVSQIIFG